MAHTTVIGREGWMIAPEGHGGLRAEGWGGLGVSGDGGTGYIEGFGGLR